MVCHTCPKQLAKKLTIKSRYTKTGIAELEGAGGGAFSPQLQFPNPAELPELQLKFYDQIAGNRISKVPVFKISVRSQSAWTPLDG